MNSFHFCNGKKCISRFFPSKGKLVPRHAQLNGNGKFVPIGTFLSSYNISSFAEISPRVEFFPKGPWTEFGNLDKDN